MPIDPLLIPQGTLCYIDQLEGTVWMAQGVPAIRWLYEVELDAWAATVGYGNRQHDYRWADPELAQHPGRTAPLARMARTGV